MQRAQEVTLLHCTASAQAEAKALPAQLSAVVDWLGRHGVRAAPLLEPAVIPIGETLLSRVADLGADLLVMGAWSRPRWLERTLGGATRSVLDSMTVPVLMAH